MSQEMGAGGEYIAAVEDGMVSCRLVEVLVLGEQLASVDVGPAHPTKTPQGTRLQQGQDAKDLASAPPSAMGSSPVIHVSVVGWSYRLIG